MINSRVIVALRKVVGQKLISLSPELPKVYQGERYTFPSTLRLYSKKDHAKYYDPVQGEIYRTDAGTPLIRLDFDKDLIEFIKTYKKDIILQLYSSKYPIESAKLASNYVFILPSEKPLSGSGFVFK